MKDSFAHLDQYREPHPITGYVGQGDTVGAFRIPHFDTRQRRENLTHFIVIASDGGECGWDHVSIHVRYRQGIDRKMRTPTWDEMCWIKDLFFDEDETVLQFHPRKTDYVNTHKHVLHLWRPVNQTIELPPMILV